VSVCVLLIKFVETYLIPSRFTQCFFSKHLHQHIKFAFEPIHPYTILLIFSVLYSFLKSKFSLNFVNNSKWEAEHAAAVQELDAKERETKNALAQTARQELDAFSAERSKRIQQSKENNKLVVDYLFLRFFVPDFFFCKKNCFRVAEQTFVTDRDTVVNSNNLWDRVAKLADVSAKPGDDNSDLSRFRSLLLQLKHTPV
jgi:hypothetical protein